MEMPTYFEAMLQKGFNGWLHQLCSLCGLRHPGSCDVGRDPEFQRLLEEYEEDPERWAELRALAASKGWRAF